MFQHPLKSHVPFALAFLLILSNLTISASAKDANAVVGMWANESSILEVKRQADTLVAIIVAARDPFYLANEAFGPPGEKRRDDQNPDESLRSRTLIGLNLLSEYSYSGKRWEGKIYDPESGNTYSSRMERDGETLKMRGYIGVPWVGRTAIFVPLANCNENMQEMLNTLKISTTECNTSE